MSEEVKFNLRPEGQEGTGSALIRRGFHSSRQLTLKLNLWRYLRYPKYINTECVLKWYTLEQVNSKSHRQNDYIDTQVMKIVSKKLLITECFPLVKKKYKVSAGCFKLVCITA